jgi:hypothetical protein
MAELFKFPGTSLDMFEKYPDSWRLDHPDFGDVAKTTFAKGVITDFEKINDVLLTVKSMVKVKGDWGESDFIPLWFCPKKKYWDSDPSLDDAQDFNQDGKYYENAWMSFRADDEVAVMLQKGKPVAVMGFADGKPKVGEAIIKVGGYTYGGSSVADAYYQAPTQPRPDVVNGNGPDGVSLNLTEEAQYYSGGGSTSIDLGTTYGGSGGNTYIKHQSSMTLKVAGAWSVIVGPIIYVFVTLGQTDSSVLSFYSVPYDNEALLLWLAELDLPGADHSIAPPGGSIFISSSSGSSETFNALGVTLAGIYTKELMDSISGYVGSIDPVAVYNDNVWGTPPEGLILQFGGGLIPSIPPAMVQLFFKPHNPQ